jgi:hypothetical protein
MIAPTVRLRTLTSKLARLILVLTAHGVGVAVGMLMMMVMVFGALAVLVLVTASGAELLTWLFGPDAVAFVSDLIPTVFSAVNLLLGVCSAVVVGVVIIGAVLPESWRGQGHGLSCRSICLDRFGFIWT